MRACPSLTLNLCVNYDKVGNLLRKHGMLGRAGGPDDEELEDEDPEDEDEGEVDAGGLAAVDDVEICEAWERLKGGPHAVAKVRACWGHDYRRPLI